MKKWLLSTGFLILLFSITCSESLAQKEVTVNVGGEQAKSASKARSLALSNTVSSIGVGWGSMAIFENNSVETAGAALVLYGIMMGPSTGNFYARDYKRGALGIAARAVGGYLMVDATREIFGHDFADALTVDDQKVSLTDTKILIGEVLVLGSMLYNVLSTQASVNEYNNRGSRFSLQIDAGTIKNKTTPLLTAQIRL